MKKNILIKAGILGAVAVIFGAFGAHILKTLLTADQLLSFETGVRYQFSHAIVLLFLFIFSLKNDSKYINKAANFIFWGVILFSGSIYILTLKNIIGLEVLKFVGPITPIGGLLMIIGWIFIVITGLKSKK